MIVENTKIGLIGATVDQSTTLSLLPGVMEFKDEHWEVVRSSMLDKIEKGIVIEHFAKIEKEKDKDGKEIVKIKATPFASLSANDQEILIKKCYSVPQLESWKSVCKESSRIALSNQIEKMTKR